MALTEIDRTQSAPQGRPEHEERAVAFFGTWAIFGLYLDGWAHIHDKPETFFSPWHGVLYSGVGVAVAWFAFREVVLRKSSAITDRWLTLGFVIFGVGAGGDFVWHEVFGIEVNLEALLSPTHLMLLTGGCLMLSMPVRIAAARSSPRTTRFRDIFPSIAALTLVALLVQFFAQYFAAHRFGGLWVADNGDDIWEVVVIGSVFVTNFILMGAAFIAVRRWDTPFGTFTVMWTMLAVGVTGMFEFRWWKHIPAMLVAGLITDLLARGLRPSIERRGHALAFACLVPLVTWSLWLVAIATSAGVRWPVDLWAGTVYLAVMQGLGLALLAFPRVHARS